MGESVNACTQSELLQILNRLKIAEEERDREISIIYEQVSKLLPIQEPLTEKLGNSPCQPQLGCLVTDLNVLIDKIVKDNGRLSVIKGTLIRLV